MFRFKKNQKGSARKTLPHASLAPAAPANPSQQSASILWAAEQGYADILKSLLDTKTEESCIVDPLDEMRFKDIQFNDGIGDISHEIIAAPSRKNGQQPCKTSDCTAALIKAADRGHVDVVDVLLQYGLRGGITGRNGWTALMVAAKGGHTDVVQRLMKSDAGRDVIPESAWESMEIVIQSGNAMLLEALADQALAKDMDVIASANVTAWAAEHGLFHAMEALLSSEKAMDIKLNEEETMEWAVKNGHVEVIRELVFAGIGPKNAEEWKKLSLIGFQAGYPDVVKALLEFKDMMESRTSSVSEEITPTVTPTVAQRKATPTVQAQTPQFTPIVMRTSSIVENSCVSRKGTGISEHMESLELITA